LNYDEAVKMRPKTPKSDKTQSFELKIHKKERNEQQANERNEKKRKTFFLNSLWIFLSAFRDTETG